MGTYLARYPLLLPLVKKSTTVAVPKHTMCIGLRSMYTDLPKFTHLLDAIVKQHSTSAYKSQIDLQLYLFDVNYHTITEMQSRDSRNLLDHLHRIVSSHNIRAGSDYVHVISEPYISYNSHLAALYYYSYSDMLLEFMLHHSLTKSKNNECGKMVR